MQAALRPMSLGEILDRTVEIYRRSFWLFCGIAALPAAGMFCVHLADLFWIHFSALLQPHNPEGAFLWFLLRGLAYYHVSGFLYMLFLPAFVRSASNAAFGERSSVSLSLHFILDRRRSYLWLAFLRYLAVLIIPEALAFCVMFAVGSIADKYGLFDGSMAAAAAVVTLLPVPAGFALMLWVGACLALAFPSSALEHTSGLKALRRSWRSSRGSRRRIIFAWLSILTIGNILSWLVYFIARWAWMLLYPHWHPGLLGRNCYSVATIFLYSMIAASIAPLFPIAATLFYFDQRVRKEGYDLERLMEAAGLQRPAPLGEAEPTAEAEKAPSLWGRIPQHHGD